MKNTREGRGERMMRKRTTTIGSTRRIRRSVVVLLLVWVLLALLGNNRGCVFVVYGYSHHPRTIRLIDDYYDYDGTNNDPTASSSSSSSYNSYSSSYVGYVADFGDSMELGVLQANLMLHPAAGGHHQDDGFDGLCTYPTDAVANFTKRYYREKKKHYDNKNNNKRNKERDKRQRQQHDHNNELILEPGQGRGENSSSSSSSSRPDVVFSPMPSDEEEEGEGEAVVTRQRGRGDEDDNYYNRHLPVALFISILGCSPERKARVALAMQERVPPAYAARYLLVFDEDDDDKKGRGRRHGGGGGSGSDDHHVRYASEDNEDSNEQEEDTALSLDEIGVLYIPHSFGVSIRNRIRRRAEMTGIDPHYLSNGTTSWMFRVSIDGSGGPKSRDRARGGSGGDHSFGARDHDAGSSSPQRTNNVRYGNDHPNHDNFYWFRFVLFSLLIVSPCCRAAYLWYAGGGRVYWRRDERTGRINGLQYIPPMPYWLSSGRGPGGGNGGSGERVSTKITEEEFDALPEIIYGHHGNSTLPALQEVPALQGEEQEQEQQQGQQQGQQQQKDEQVVVHDTDDKENNNSNSNSNSNSNAPQQQQQQVQQLPGEGTSSATAMPFHQSGHQSATTTPATAAGTTGEDLTVAPTAVVAASATTTTLCTMCSICIDEFEPGDALKLLPRCNHAFHKDCIKPWLLERQGCCPLCKTCVNEQEEEDEKQEGEGDNDDDDQQQQDDNRGEQEQEAADRNNSNHNNNREGNNTTTSNQH